MNVGAAGVERARRIAAWLAARGDDLVVLTETSGGEGGRLLARALADTGHHVVWAPERSDRGVLLAARVGLAGPLRWRGASVPCRTAGLVLDTAPRIAVLGVYVPSRARAQTERKQRFVASLLDAIAALPDQTRGHLLLAGDYNTAARDHDPRLADMLAFEHAMHDRLRSLGLRAAHELRPGPGGQPHSWVGRTGTGRLYDYVHLGRALHRRVRSCAYLHETRETGLSDHAAVQADVALDG